MPELEVHVSKIAMRINSAYSSLTHQPLVFLRHDISYSQFLALMNVAEILIVSSLREGMNLTSHDYVNSQDGKLAPQRHGSLILSEFTGSASIFVGHELLVNPWDYQEVADTINKALGALSGAKTAQLAVPLEQNGFSHCIILGQLLPRMPGQFTQSTVLSQTEPSSISFRQRPEETIRKL